ncbi:hypothetical protein G3I19_04910 [Streptomyces sp. SID10853]|uniref:hypothetical protein n=1 Tax=Streptomyces sp. SID10853 TaxID=2706028 RepID=UPI0013C27956|nr:hypothetical protein [Streptomyces sp. SID10853]NDZ77874.1 hypothetical protein [Streptomyces sp. SID10853]
MNGGPEGAGHRVAVREIREAAFRAVVAAGASSGEAATAADLVVLGEVLDGTGVRALADELDRVPQGRQPVSCSGDTLVVLHDPAGRGPLLLGPPAADLAAAGRRPVLLPGAWTSPVEWILVSAVARTRTPLLATRIRADGSPGACALATADSTLHRADHPRAFDEPHDGQAADTVEPRMAVPPGEGILLSRWNGDARTPDLLAGLPPARTPARQHERFAAALTHGLRVAPEPWATVYGASRRYLVPEHP